MNIEHLLIEDLNVTYSEMLDVTTDIINKYSNNKNDDLIQIKKFRELILDDSTINWKYFIQGWCVATYHKYSDISFKKYLRIVKLESIDNEN